MRFDYLVLPLNLKFSSAGNEQGLLLLAGSYFGLLTGGNYKSSSSASVNGRNRGGGSDSGSVTAGDTYDTSYLHR